ncbi:MAG: aminotransferase class V-fold PLP-dependent enzyme [SAR324 cluster bacterium]|nr:aminotransferase class V-fold PLP-dependent enzyme [SAR324 cluster bacterium]
MGLHAGRHFLQIPGPTNVPDRVLRAMSMPTIDHRGAEFAELGKTVLSGIKRIFKTSGPVVIFPGSGSGAWEAALVNTLSSGDQILMFETGHFANLWAALAKNLGLKVEMLSGDWRSGVDVEQIKAVLAKDREKKIKAVAIVHNETSTGVTSNVKAVRSAIDQAEHSALLLVDTISSLGSINYCHEEWEVDVTVGGSQKGLMLPPGLGFNALSEKALAASENASLPRSYWDWKSMLGPNQDGFFPYTPATNLLYGLREAIEMLEEEGLDQVFARHDRLAEATRRAVRAWGLEIQCRSEKEHSSSLTTVRMPGGTGANALRGIISDHYDMSLGTGLAKLSDQVFRIGHLGHFNELMLAGTLCGVEMGLTLAQTSFKPGGVVSALDYLAETAQANPS